MQSDTTILLPDGPAEPALDRGSLLFVGTATTVIQLGGFTVLTDPNFLHAGDHAHLGYGLTSRRLTEPALGVDELPPLDACVLSHFHGDHWDEVATATLPKDLPVLTTEHAARALRRRGFRRATALATWSSATLRRGPSWLRVTALPGRHGPPVVAALLPPVMGSLLEWGAGPDAEARYRLYVSGDTLVHDELLEIPRRFPHVDLGLFHLGGTRVLGVLVTMDASQGIQAIRIVNPDRAIPIHFDDYPVFQSPLEDFVDAVARAGLAARVTFLGRGERYEITVPSEASPTPHPPRPGRAMGEAAPSPDAGHPEERS